MKGLELEFNGKKTVAAIKKGVLTIVTSVNTVNEDTEINVDFRGLNVEKKEHLNWADISIQVGDTMTIKVVDVDQISPIIEHRDAIPHTGGK